MPSPPKTSQSLWTYIVVLTLMAATVFMTNLGAARLWDRDEPRNAGCAAEMLQRNDWVTPIFNSELRGQKPVLLYWLMMSAYSTFGVNEFSARFWSAALGIGTVLLTYLMGRHLMGRSTGIWAALVLSTTLMFTVASRAATPDAPLIFFSTLAISSYVLLTFRSIDSLKLAGESSASIDKWLKEPGVWFPRGWNSLGVYIPMALGVLAKGPIAAVLPSCIIGLFVMLNGRPSSPASRWKRWLATVSPVLFLQTLWRMQPWMLLLAVGTIAMPWFIWVGVRTEGDFLQWFFFEEHLGRAISAMENHSGGPWYYPAAILVGFFPWSILAIPVGIGVYRKLNTPSDRNVSQEQLLTLALTWLSLQIVVFTLVRTKLPSYVTPCYPAIALLMGTMLSHWSQGREFCNRFWLRGSYVASILVGLAILIGLPLAINQLKLNGAGLALIGLVPLLTGITAAILSYRNHFEQIPRILAGGSWAFVFLFFAIGTTVVDQNRETDELWNHLRATQTSHSRLATYRCLESSWVYYAEQPIWELTPETQKLESQTLPDREDASTTSTDMPQGSVIPVAFASDTTSGHGESSSPAIQADPLNQKRPWHVKPRPTALQLVAAYPDSYIVVPDQYLAELLTQLPADYHEVARCRQFLKKGELVLVGKR